MAAVGTGNVIIAPQRFTDAHGNGFLPGVYQPTLLRNAGSPVLYLNAPGRAGGDRDVLDLAQWLNRKHREDRGENVDVEDVVRQVWSLPLAVAADVRNPLVFAGTLVLSGLSNTYGGSGQTTAISAGTLVAGADANLGNAANADFGNTWLLCSSSHCFSSANTGPACCCRR